MPARKPLTDAATAFLRGDEPPAPAPTPVQPPVPMPRAAEPDREATVRFTVDLPRSLHKRLKLAALNRDEAMTDLARRALREWLDSET